MTRRSDIFVITAAMCLAFAWPAPAARAGVVVTISESGGNVVASGGGSLDLKDLTFESSPPYTSPILHPTFGDVRLGPSQNAGGLESSYTGISGPMSFGTGGQSPQGTPSGSSVELDGFGGAISVPSSYVSGTPLTTGATWTNQTFASLGLTPGTYVWTWGTGSDADSYTLQIGAVPEPSSAVLAVLGTVAVIAAYGWSRHRREHRRQAAQDEDSGEAHVLARLSPAVTG
jgi:hypothetical protein